MKRQDPSFGSPRDDGHQGHSGGAEHEEGGSLGPAKVGGHGSDVIGEGIDPTLQQVEGILGHIRHGGHPGDARHLGCHEPRQEKPATHRPMGHRPPEGRLHVPKTPQGFPRHQEEGKHKRVLVCEEGQAKEQDRSPQLPSATPLSKPQIQDERGEKERREQRMEQGAHIGNCLVAEGKRGEG